MSKTERDARLILAALTTPKFKGRAELLKLAESGTAHLIKAAEAKYGRYDVRATGRAGFRTRVEAQRWADFLSEFGEPGDDTALDVIEMTPQQRQIAMIRGKLSPEVLAIFAADPVYRAAVAKRSDRASPYYRRFGTQRDYRIGAPDPLASRAPGGTSERFVLEIFDRSVRRAGFRSGSGGIKRHVEYVRPGEEGMDDKSTWVKRRGSGWGALKTVQHWRVSSEILKVPSTRPDGARWDGKYLWLTPTLRVRQGRGTALMVEQVKR